ncbi:MAG: aminomethyl transferase family protein [Myxococcales bacterium]|nr:aminomethyl transferase family protein [Myxococcales bacterium]
MASVRRFSLGIIDLRGEDRVRFLHGMVSNDVEKLEAGQGCHAAMLTTKGKLLADVVVLHAPERLRIVLAPELLDKIRAHLEKHIVMDDVEVDAAATAAVGVYGDDAAAAVAHASGLDAATLAALPPYGFVDAVVRTRELGGVGFWLIGSGGASVDGATLDDGEFEERRIEAGTPRYGVDMGEDRLPIEAGINDAVSFDKGCYLGQEVIARATNLGHINRRLVGLVLDGDAPAAAGAKLSSASRPEAGFITSSARSRRLGKTIALGYVHRTLWAPGTQLTVADGRTATVAALPFQ